MIKPFIAYCTILLTLVSFSAKAQRQDKDLAYLRYCLKILAADSMGGREPGTAYDTMASEFIAGEFMKARLKPFRNTSCFQEFYYTKDSLMRNTRNVIAMINNKATENIVIGAHYDHLGFGGTRSRSYGKHEVHNGADDNGSGVALMLSIAGRLRQQNLKNFNFIFVSFSGHEDGLFGSDYFVNNDFVAISSIKLMINLDMVGRADTLNPTVFVGGNDTSYISRFKSLAIQQPLIRIGDKELPEGDHSAFASRNIPVLLLTTGMEEDYHKVSDDECLINYKAMLITERLIISFLKSINSIRK